MVAVTPWRYDYLAGPLPVDSIDAPVERGNCRLLVQRYFLARHGIRLAPDAVLNPRLFRTTGEFVRRGRPIELAGLPDDAVLFAERRITADGSPVERGPETFSHESAWVWRLHSAVWLASYDPEAEWLQGIPSRVSAGDPGVLHSTGFADTVVVWSVEEFVRFYLPVAAKAVTAEPPQRAAPAGAAGAAEMVPGLRPAVALETMEIHQLRLDLVSWLKSRGIEQWGADDIPPWRVADQADAGEWWVISAASDGLSAAVRLIDHDSLIWGDRDGRACYVHGLMVARSHSGQGLGGRLLQWCEREAVRRGAEVLRLDCVETNHGLRRYYRDHGFSEVGRREFRGGWHPVCLLEKELASPIT